jgi:hypothetical protein
VQPTTGDQLLERLQEQFPNDTRKEAIERFAREVVRYPDAARDVLRHLAEHGFAVQVAIEGVKALEVMKTVVEKLELLEVMEAVVEKLEAEPIDQ